MGPPSFTNNPSAGDQPVGSDPSSDSEDQQYPGIDEFFQELEKTHAIGHYFTELTDNFRNHGYLTIDQLADLGLDVKHMMELSPSLKEGTVQLIKTKVLKKVKHIRKQRK